MHALGLGPARLCFGGAVQKLALTHALDGVLDGEGRPGGDAVGVADRRPAVLLLLLGDPDETTPG